jgi:competence protein ComEA
MLKKLLALVLMLFTALAMAAVDVNKATDAQLDSVKGIGPVTSKTILAERKKGHFKDWQDFIDRVKGIGDKRAADLSAQGLTVNGESYKAAAATKKEEKKEAKAAAKEDKKEAKAEKKEDKVTASKPAASASKAASAKK